jgi:hypothetical protein
VDSLLSILKRPARLGDSKTIISRRDVEIRMDLEPMCTAQCVSVVIINGLAAILFMIRYVLFGVAMIRTATLPRWSGVLVAVGAPAHLLGFGIAQLVSTAAWPIASLGSVSLGAGTAHRVRVIIFAPRSGCAICGAQSKPGEVSRSLRALWKCLLGHPFWCLARAPSDALTIPSAAEVYFFGFTGSRISSGSGLEGHPPPSPSARTRSTPGCMG